MVTKKQFLLLMFIYFTFMVSVYGQPQLPADGAPASMAAFKQYNQRIFVSINDDDKHYYEATITNKNDKIIVSILDQEIQTQTLIFDTENCIVFIDAYKNLILVKQTAKNGTIIAFWLIQIVYNAKTDKFSLDSFSINSHTDDQFYPIDTLVNLEIPFILEYDQQNQWLYVLATAKIPNGMKVYKINVGQRINVFFTVMNYEFKGERITGGNGHVLYDQKNDQLMIDTHNCRKPDDPTVFSRVPICELTKLPLFANGGRTYNLVGWYFEYVSSSKDRKSLTAFIFEGKGDQPIQGQVSLKSDKPIKIWSDDYNYFIAVTHCDVYLVNVFWDAQKKNYKQITATLSRTIDNQKKRKQVYDYFEDAVKIVFLDEKFYILAKDNQFVVLGTGKKAFVKLYQVECVTHITRDTDISEVMFKEIRRYLARKDNDTDSSRLQRNSRIVRVQNQSVRSRNSRKQGVQSRSQRSRRQKYSRWNDGSRRSNIVGDRNSGKSRNSGVQNKYQRNAWKH